MVLHHIFDSQILNHDRLVRAYQLSCQLMQKILSSIGDLCVDFSHFQPCFVSVVTPLLLPRQCFLHPFQLLTKLLKVFGISNFIAVTGGNQTGYPDIQTDLFADGRGLGGFPHERPVQDIDFCGTVMPKM